MKRVVSFLLCLGLLFCMTGCDRNPSTDDQPAPEPSYNDAPAAAEMTLTVNGNPLGAYQKDGTLYTDLSALCEILGGSITTDAAEQPPYSATLTLTEHSYTISEQSTTLNEGESAHPMVYTPIYDGERWYAALEPIMSLMGLHLLEDSENNHRYYTAFPYASDVKAGVNISVLMYHAVLDDPWSSITELFVKPAEFEKQLVYLTENGYTPITFEDFDKLDSIQKPVMLTFDDGYDDNYTEVFPLLKKYNVKATIFVITSLIGTEHYLTEAQIQEMDASGLVSIQSHTVTHPYLSDLSEEQLQEELLLSKLSIARITGKEPFVLCYPTGKYSSLSLQKTEEHYQFGILMNGGMYTTGSDSAVMIPRYYISRATTLNAFVSKLN